MLFFNPTCRQWLIITNKKLLFKYVDMPSTRNKKYMKTQIPHFCVECYSTRASKPQVTPLTQDKRTLWVWILRKRISWKFTKWNRRWKFAPHYLLHSVATSSYVHTLTCYIQQLTPINHLATKLLHMVSITRHVCTLQYRIKIFGHFIHSRTALRINSSYLLFASSISSITAMSGIVIRFSFAVFMLEKLTHNNVILPHSFVHVRSAMLSLGIFFL